MIPFWQKGEVMSETEETQAEYIRTGHPWIEMPEDGSLDEAVRYSLDEIRIG